MKFVNFLSELNEKINILLYENSVMIVNYETTNSSFKYYVISICFLVLLVFIVHPVYAQLSGVIIIKATIGELNIAPGDLISPSANNPLEFVMTSNIPFSSYTCKIIKIDGDLFNNILDGTFSPSNFVAGNNITTQLCGSGNDISIKYTEKFIDGTYVFQAIGLTNAGIGTKGLFPFEVVTINEEEKDE